MTRSFISTPLGIKVVNRIIPNFMLPFKGQAMADGAGAFQKSLQAIQRLLCGSKQLRGDWRKAGDLDQLASQREAFPFKMLFHCHRSKPLNGAFSSSGSRLTAATRVVTIRNDKVTVNSTGGASMRYVFCLLLLRHKLQHLFSHNNIRYPFRVSKLLRT
jgi:hypothetical protein